jgi:hypothetical protein
VNILEVLIVHNAMFMYNPNKVHLNASHYEGPQQINFCFGLQ